jgi:hypothetical protein
MKTPSLALLFGLLAASAPAQTVLFDFSTASQYSPLPINLTVGGVSAHFSSTGLGGYSIQLYNCQGLNPAGFSGLCLYPSSVYGADLNVSFSKPLIAFSILYSPQELGCDFSATMRVTAYMNGVLVDTATTNATALCPCTWPSQTLAISTLQPFNSVVVRYDTAPACADIGPIFMADNMYVTPAPTIVLNSPARLTNGTFQFSFTNPPGTPFTVFSCTNPWLPMSNWAILTGLTESPAGQFQFTDPWATNSPRRFYRVRTP